MLKLHPLHSREKLAQHILTEGTLPDMERGTGRTTAIALEAIARAIKSPYRSFELLDHFNNSEYLLRVVRAYVNLLGLEHMYIRKVRIVTPNSDTWRAELTFGKPDSGVGWILCHKARSTVTLDVPPNFGFGRDTL